MSSFKIKFHHEGLFVNNPFRYVNGDVDLMDDKGKFSNMLYDEVFNLIRECVSSPPVQFYYCITGMGLDKGLRELKHDGHLVEFVKLGQEHGTIDFYVEHHGYDVLNDFDFTLHAEPEFDSEDELPPIEPDVSEYVNLHNEGEDDVVIPNRSIRDPFLTKLCSGDFISSFDEKTCIPDPHGPDYILNEDDVEEVEVDARYKIKHGLVYPIHDPNRPWNEMEPILGMRFESPEQLKHCIINYGVAHGYQLWYRRNDFRSILVRCGRDVSKGICASGHIKRKESNEIGESSKQGQKAGSKKAKRKKAKAKKYKVRSKKLMDALLGFSHHGCKMSILSKSKH